jgi:hypothetical protein
VHVFHSAQKPFRKITCHHISIRWRMSYRGQYHARLVSHRRSTGVSGHISFGHLDVQPWQTENRYRFILCRLVRIGPRCTCAGWQRLPLMGRTMRRGTRSLLLLRLSCHRTRKPLIRYVIFPTTSYPPTDVAVQVQLAETFLGIAESLRKPRGALLH